MNYWICVPHIDRFEDLLLNKKFVLLQARIHQPGGVYFPRPITIGKPITLTNSRCSKCSCGINRHWTRIIGGWMAEVNEYPWMVALTKRNRFFCGGTLINDRYVTTAAHCIYRKEGDSNWVTTEVKVILSEHNRVAVNDTINEERRVVKALIHPKFSASTLDSDIALLKLDKPVRFRQEVRPACLPPTNKKFHGEWATVVGWGTTQEGGSPAITLRETVVPIMSNQQCTSAGYRALKITDNMMCAGGYRGRDSCQGDSGGPLLLTTPQGQMFTAGIVSWGEGCGRPNKPGVYTRVNNFLDWIMANTKDACYCY
ncbi:hypothetical protein RUM44_010314 [Polyplax serrata]|uniref:Peptidase S1 domain-containing protein n=1 Tax=Polyplax serrata TaxID=468196 RepID=A0ABR1AV62_POLSC